MKLFADFVISHQLVLVILLVITLVLPGQTFILAQKRARIQDGPPKRPDLFRSVEELNDYLTRLTDYYTVLGRPRFGKRASPPSTDEFMGSDTRSDEMQSNPSDTENDVNSRLTVALLKLLLSRDYESASI